MSDGNGKYNGDHSGNGGNQGPPGSIPGIPFAKGDDPRRGHGLPGRSGRKSNVYKEALRHILESKEHREALEKVLTDAGHPAFANLTRTASAQVYGQPKQVVEVEGDMPTLAIVRDQAAVQSAIQAGQHDDE